MQSPATIEEVGDAIGDMRAVLTDELGSLKVGLRRMRDLFDRRDAEVTKLKDLVRSLRSDLHARDVELDQLRAARASAIAELARLRRGVFAWLTFRPGSRPHRIARRFGLVAAEAQQPLPQIGAPVQEARGGGETLDPPRPNPPIVYLFVDHTVGCGVNTGIQRAVRGLAWGLMHNHQPVRFVKWDPASRSCVLISEAEREHLARWNGPPVKEKERELYQNGALPPLPLDLRPSDWLIVPEATCITNQARQVSLELVRWAREHRISVGFVFYDAIPLRRPELSAAVPAQKQYMRALRHVDAVWSISKWSAADLTAFLLSEGGDLPPIYEVPLPGSFDAPRATAQSPREEPLILSVGTVEPRKNQVALVNAFRKYRSANPKSAWRLVLVGNLHPLVAAEIHAATAADKSIIYLGHIPDDELNDLYERCAFTVFPSVEEGLGLPILESLWHGKPCLCADFGSMAEVAERGGCLTCDTRDEKVLESELAKLIEDAGLRAELKAQARERPLSNWSDYASTIVRSAWPVGQIYYLAEATAVWERNTGIQRVVRQLARALLDLGLDLIPVKFGPNGTIEPLSGDDLVRLSAFNGPAPRRWRGWLTPEKAADNSWFFLPELPHHLSHQQHAALIANLHRLKVRSAAIFYDAIPWKMTDMYSEPFNRMHEAYMRSLADYDFLTAISAHSRDDFITFRKVASLPTASDVFVSPLAGEFSESPRETRVHVPPAEGPLRILCVGTIEPRKNHQTLLRAFVKAAAQSSRPLHLTLVGANTNKLDPTLSDRVAAFVARHPSITWELNADDEKLRGLYESCDFTVFASFEEGFGLPILESLWYARPVVCADFGAMKEVGEGGGCVMVDVRDVDALAAAIRALAEQPSRIEALSREAVARRFRTWDDYAVDLAAHLRLPALSPLAPPNDLARRPVELGLARPTKSKQSSQSTLTIYLLAESTAVYDRNTGIQRVVRQLARALVQKGAAVIPVRWDAETRKLAMVAQQGLENLSRFNGPKISDWASWREPSAAPGAWFLLAEVQQHWRNGDHTHLIESLKAHGVRLSAIFHDAIPIKMPQLYPTWLSQAHYRYMIELGYYDLVFPNSHYTASDLREFLSERGADGVRLDRLVKANPLAGEFPSIPRCTEHRQLRATETLRLLSVGTVEPRKNHETLVRAFLLAQDLCVRPIELTIVGNTNAIDPGLADRIRKQIAGRPSIQWLEKVDDEELAELQYSAHLMVYPSIEEGFGLPILESLWHGVPVICAEFGAMAEAANAVGGGCLTVDVRDPEAFAAAIAAVADDADLFNRLAREAVTCPIKSWESYAEQIIAHLTDIDGNQADSAVRADRRLASG